VLCADISGNDLEKAREPLSRARRIEERLHRWATT
jgi:hypothetical protein